MPEGQRDERPERKKDREDRERAAAWKRAGGRGDAGEGRMEKDSGSAGTVWQKEMPGEGRKAWK